MTATQQKVEVSLFGQRFVVKTERNEEYVYALVRRVNKILEDIRKQTKVSSTHHVALLAAIHLADCLLHKEEEVIKLQEEVQDIKDKVHTKTNILLEYLDTSLGELELQEEIVQTQEGPEVQ